MSVAPGPGQNGKEVSASQWCGGGGGGGAAGSLGNPGRLFISPGLAISDDNDVSYSVSALTNLQSLACE
ncbi:MAG: hypothetical protein JW841_16935 [Deltaproteobacteria bacterium]|nr:hypothetical protein [Deltaproteobacteria bacterium]